MKISVITPSFNQAQFLPDNLRTVSGQKGVDFEHIVIDPGSTDGSTEIARAEKHAILVNEPDRGQSHGITKGYAMATGDIVVWLNSDDFYPSDDVLSKVIKAFEENPDADVIYGNVNFVDENGKFLRKGYVNKNGSSLLDSFQYQVGIVQPGVFMKKKVFDAVGGPSEDYNYCMDYEYWVRIASAGFKWVFVDEVLAHHRWWSGMKTSSGRGDSLVEHFKVGINYFGYIHHKWIDRYGEYLATNSDGVVNHATEIDDGAKKAYVRLAIERFVTQDMLAVLEAASDKEMVDTLSYVRAHAPDVRRIFFDAAELKDATSRHSDPMAEQRVAWHVFDTTTPAGEQFKTYMVPNNFSRSFDADWYYYQHARSVEGLERLSRKRKDVCVIVANGPSLNKTNFDLLGAADVILSNYAVISKDLMQHATYLTIVNDLVAKQGATQFNSIDLPKIVPFWLGNSLNATDTTFFVPATVEPVFNHSIGGNFSWRSTVSFLNMQLAFALGYERVALVGFDHSYQQAPEMKEGMAVDQKTEDPNHFDPRYFQGKVWQAADTGNMEKMYLVARDAYAAAGRTIVNATVGGKLEVFPRMSLEDVLGHDAQPIYASVSLPEKLPRLLVLDMTEMGNGTATGEIKSNLLKEWPQDALMQVAQKDGKTFARVIPHGDSFESTALQPEDADSAIDAFRPELVLFRPVAETPSLNKLALDTVKRLGIPMITWVMDDWPARLAVQDPKRWGETEADYLQALRGATRRLSICDSMSKAFGARYGLEFEALANGIDPVDWPESLLQEREGKGKRFTIRYAGGIAQDMNRASLLRIAEAVEALKGMGMDVCFQISTQKWWLDQCAELFAPFKATSLELSDKTTVEYRRWISEADLLLIAYNFDEASLRYVQYSMANKMPECLASGVAVLAHGPMAAATIEYLSTNKIAMVVAEPDVKALREAITLLYENSAERKAIGAAGRARALENHNIHRLRKKFSSIASQAAMVRPLTLSNAAEGEWSGGLRAELIRLSSELLLGRRDAASLAADSKISAFIARAEAELPKDDPTLMHFQRVRRFPSGSAMW